MVHVAFWHIVLPAEKITNEKDCSKKSKSTIGFFTRENMAEPNQITWETLYLSRHSLWLENEKSNQIKSKSNQIVLSSITRGVVAQSPEPEAHVLSIQAFWV